MSHPQRGRGPAAQPCMQLLPGGTQPPSGARGAGFFTYACNLTSYRPNTAILLRKRRIHSRQQNISFSLIVEFMERVDIEWETGRQPPQAWECDRPLGRRPGPVRRSFWPTNNWLASSSRARITRGLNVSVRRSLRPDSIRNLTRRPESRIRNEGVSIVFSLKEDERRTSLSCLLCRRIASVPEPSSLQLPRMPFSRSQSRIRRKASTRLPLATSIRLWS